MAKYKYEAIETEYLFLWFARSYGAEKIHHVNLRLCSGLEILIKKTLLLPEIVSSNLRDF